MRRALVAALLGCLFACSSSKGTDTPDDPIDDRPVDPLGQKPVNGLLQPSTSRLIFLSKKAQPSDEKTVVLHNAGTEAIEVKGLDLSGQAASQFTMTGAPGLPFQVAAGQELTLAFKFVPTGVGTVGEKLTVTSNDPQIPVRELDLRGLSWDGIKEPSPQAILNTFQLSVDTGNPASAAQRVGDEIEAQKFVKAGPGVVSIDVWAMFGPPDVDPVVKLRWYDPATPMITKELFSINKAYAISVLPPLIAGSVTTFDPGAAAFALSTFWPQFQTDVRQEDARNEFDPGHPHHMRIYPYKKADGTVVANTYVVILEEVAGGDDYNDIVFVIENVRPAGAGVLRLENQDKVPSNEWMVFNRVERPQRYDGDPEPVTQPLVTKDKGVLRIYNDGATPVTLSVAASGNFTAAFTGGFTGPSLEAGASADVLVTFTANAANVSTQVSHLEKGELLISSSDKPSPTRVELRGYWQPYREDKMEPPLKNLINDVFGYKTNIGTPFDGKEVPVGEETIARYWMRANDALPVHVLELAAYHIHPLTSAVYWYCHAQRTSDFNGLRDLFGTSGTEAQSLLPSMQPTPQNSNVNEFDPNVCPDGDKTFGFAVNAGEFSDPELTKTCGATQKEPCGDSGHHLRFWPLKDSTGALVPNAYIVGMDSNNVNFDYNDDVYLITNIAPIPLTP